jgi:hypothetical protein
MSITLSRHKRLGTTATVGTDLCWMSTQKDPIFVECPLRKTRYRFRNGFVLNVHSERPDIRWMSTQKDPISISLSRVRNDSNSGNGFVLNVHSERSDIRWMSTQKDPIFVDHTSPQERICNCNINIVQVSTPWKPTDCNCNINIVHRQTSILLLVLRVLVPESTRLVVAWLTRFPLPPRSPLGLNLIIILMGG